mmetsp:Transcript_80326/g.222176  ORF Transcript_80326/g.222176 Transcript_80326/m.222176 type:complete len:104 (+) Transcript_80326:22-333(+)
MGARRNLPQTVAHHLELRRSRGGHHWQLGGHSCWLPTPLQLQDTGQKYRKEPWNMREGGKQVVAVILLQSTWPQVLSNRWPPGSARISTGAKSLQGRLLSSSL